MTAYDKFQMASINHPIGMRDSPYPQASVRDSASCCVTSAKSEVETPSARAESQRDTLIRGRVHKHDDERRHNEMRLKWLCAVDPLILRQYWLMCIHADSAV